jgi:hypothetical protein
MGKIEIPQEAENMVRRQFHQTILNSHRKVTIRRPVALQGWIVGYMM